MTDNTYLMSGQASELGRLQLQSRVWEPDGRSLLAGLPRDDVARVLDVGCGAMGWLRVLAEWVADGGAVVGTDISADLLAAAASFVSDEGLAGVELCIDDLFHSSLEPASFDLVHARFMLAPIGRADEQTVAFAGLVRPGGWLVLEEPDSASWHFNPPAPAAERLIGLVLEAFHAGGGDFDAGRTLRARLTRLGVEPTVAARVHALPPGHPYLRLPLQFAMSLAPRISAMVGEVELANLRADVEEELALPDRWGTTFTLVQAFGRVPAS